MVRKKNKKNNFYYIQCGDWEGVTVGSNAKDACKTAVSQALEFFGTNIKTTAVMISSNCDMSLNDKDSAVEAFYVDNILEEMHEH